MNELQRTEYLEALGVTSYMPRFLLPLAPPPRRARLPLAPGPERAVADPSPEAPPRPSGRRPDSALPRDIGALTEQVTAAPALQPQPAEIAAPSAQVAPFILSCWWLGEELLAVDSREPGVALPVEALFDNILRALNWQQLPRERDRLRWPLAENRFGPAADAADARDTCASWLTAACARRPVKSIWLMGRQARDFCAPVPLAAPVTDWNGVRILAMPSLTQLLQQPLRKRELWQLLQQTYPEQTRV